MADIKKEKSFKVYLEGEWVSFTREMVSAMSPEVRELYQRDSWRQSSQRDRNSRCMVPGHNGKPRRCTEKCSNCPYISEEDSALGRIGDRTGRTLSLDSYEETNGALPDNYSTSVEEYIEQKNLHEALHSAIDTLESKEKEIVLLCKEGKTERDIASIIGACQKTVNNHKKKAFSKLKEKLKDWC